jgi:hypothetical protein
VQPVMPSSANRGSANLILARERNRGFMEFEGCLL